MSVSSQNHALDPWSSMLEVMNLQKPTVLGRYEMTVKKFALEHGISQPRAERFLRLLVEQGRASVEKRLVLVNGVGRTANVFTLRGVKDAAPKPVDRTAGRYSRRR